MPAITNPVPVPINARVSAPHMSVLECIADELAQAVHVADVPIADLAVSFRPGTFKSLSEQSLLPDVTKD